MFCETTTVILIKVGASFSSDLAMEVFGNVSRQQRFALWTTIEEKEKSETRRDACGTV